MTIDLKNAIVRIIDSDDNTVGTGFVLTDDGLIATCAHVIESTGAGPSDTCAWYSTKPVTRPPLL